MIIDAHHHLWDTDRLRYPLFDQVPALNRPFLLDQFESVMVANGISQSICVEAASAGANGLSETAWLLDQLRRSGRLKHIVAWAPIERGDCAGYFEQLATMHRGEIVGVRRSFEFEAVDFACRDTVVSGVQLAGREGYVVDLVLFSPSLPAAIELVRLCPSVTFVLDHLGKPLVRQKLLEPWLGHIEAMAQYPNVACKISGLTTEADHNHWTAEELRPYVEHVVKCFGWRRVMFGSDWPVCDLARGYSAWLATLNELLGDASAAQRKQFYSGNASRVYRLDRTL